MSILSTEENRIQYISNGTVGPYTFPYLFLQDGDIKVVVTEIATNIDVEKTLGSHYTVSGVGLQAGGSITWVSGQQPAASTYRITITREVDYKQETDYTEADNFPAETHENALTKLTMQTQQLRSLVGRSIRVPETDVLDLPLLPASSARANQFLAFDSNGNPIAASTNPVSTPVSPFMSTVVSATDAVTAAGSLQVVGKVATVAALKALTKTSLVDGVAVLVEGYYTRGDAGGGVWYWDASSVVTDNGGTFLQSNAGGTGRWRLVHTGTVTVLQFGAKGDGTTNDQPAIQAAITYGAANNQHVHLPGWISSGTEAVYKCTSQVAIPASRAFKLTMHGGHWQFTSALGANAGLFFDSCMMMEVDLQGEIVYAGTGDAVLFKPTNNVPIDAITTCIDSKIKINTIVNTNITSSDANINFDSDLGPITGCRFEFLELNGEGAGGGGGLTDFGIRVSTPGVGSGFTDNFITCPHIHHHKSSSVQVGTTTTRAAQIARNSWDVVCYPNATKTGFDCFGVKQFGFVNVTNGVGTPNIGITLQSTADKCLLQSTELAATTAINEQSTTKANLVLFKSSRSRNTISVGASPFVYQAVAGRCEKVIVTGGNVSNVEYSCDGTNYDQVAGATNTDVDLWPGDRVRVTYSVAPTMRTCLDV